MKTNIVVAPIQVSSFFEHLSHTIRRLSLVVVPTVLVSFATQASALSTQEVIEKVAGVLFVGPNAKNQIEAFKFALKSPACAEKIATSTTSQDYSIVGFVYTLKAYKVTSSSIAQIPQMNDAATCMAYNPMQRLYAFVDSTAAKYGPDKLLPDGKGGQIAAGYLKQQIDEKIAQGKNQLDASIATIPVAGPILTNWNCECDAAFNTNLAEEDALKNAFALAKNLKTAISKPDIPKLLEIMLTIGLSAEQVCKLGQDFVGTSNVPIVSTIVDKTCSGLLGKAAGWVVGAAGSAYNAIVGTPHMPGPEYYSKYWAPQIPLGAQILSYAGATKWGEFLVPLYTSCYDYFTDSKWGADKMSPSSATETCKLHQQNFSDAVKNVEVPKMDNQGRLGIIATYDAKMPSWRKPWYEICNVTDIKVTDTCKMKVQAAFDNGRAAAVGFWQVCKVAATSSFDFDKCAKMGYDKIANPFQKSELDSAVKEARASPKVGTSLNNDGAVKYQANGYALMWVLKCQSKTCIDDNKVIAMNCAMGVNNLPGIVEGSSEFPSVSQKRKDEYIAANCTPQFEASIEKSKSDKAQADNMAATYYAKMWQDKCVDELCKSNLFSMMLARMLEEDELKDSNGLKVKLGGVMPVGLYNALTVKYEEKARQEITASGPRAANVRKDAIQQMAASYLGKCSTLLCKANVMTKAAEWYDAIFTLDTKTPVQLAQKNQLDASYRKQLAALVGDAPASGSSTFGSPAPSAAIAAGAAGAGSVPGATTPTKSSITTLTKTSATAPTTAPNNLPSPAVAAPPTTPPPTQPSNSPAGRPAPIQSLTTTTALDAANEKLLKEKSCVNVAGGKAGSYQCKTSDGIKVCEALKRDQKVIDCKRIN